ncbi:MAG TPA: glycosyltransferase [Micromonosporaceae bacterium]|nr:glycosyltransferase [Micromonosporaceae bacterium]
MTAAIRACATAISDASAWFGRAVLRNKLMTVLLVVGIGLRALVIYAYRPAFIYVDSVTIYLNHLPGSTLPWSQYPSPDPLGYDILWLRPLLAVGNLLTVVVLQHLLGIAMAVVIYLVLVRRGVWRWLAALATAPLLLDAYQLNIEHFIMSDTVFEALLVAGFAVLCWRRCPPWPAVLTAGLLLGAAATVRAVGVVLILVAVVYVLFTSGRGRWWRGKIAMATLTAAAFVAPLLAYQVYTVSDKAVFTPNEVRSNAMYARVATFVDCSALDLPSYEQQLCPKEPLGSRRTPDYYAHNTDSPLFHVLLPAGWQFNDLVDDFSYRAIAAQPLDLVRSVAVDAVQVFRWNRDNVNPDAPTDRWQFKPTYPVYPVAVTAQTLYHLSDLYGGGPPRIVPMAAAMLREYQLTFGFTPGPLLLIAILLAIIAVIRGGRYGRAPARMATLAYLGGGVLVLLAADAYEFTWRYQLPALVFIPAAGALAVATLRWRPKPPAFPERADSRVIDAFDREYGATALGPVAVVIAAYREAGSIGAVLDRIPAVTRDLSGGSPLRVSTLVVVDGDNDDTAVISREHGAYTAVMPANRGQGAALRLGYHLARAGGARYVVTTDGDGQYDIDQLPALLEPLRTGEADFVTGSRRLGRDESRDRVRRTGVRFFATLVSVLTRHHVTDTSFGFRAMRADVTAAVRLDQPQYQASELLISVIMHGYRVAEVPMTMHPRTGGRSKKGANWRYGLRYSGVVLSTWARERRGEPANTYLSSTRNLPTKVTANAPK